MCNYVEFNSYDQPNQPDHDDYGDDEYWANDPTDDHNFDQYPNDHYPDDDFNHYAGGHYE